LPGFPALYLLSAPLNRLDFDPSYPKAPKTFGERLRKFRKEKGLSMRQFAEELGVSEDTVINWEVREVRPGRRNLESLLKVLSDVYTNSQ
jgi:DNA-binding transcriptional regulator YiaG